ncbi:MAG: hypothetical protein KGI94_13345 [Paracoccaceae bacterium]|nr:hypothetical protein [Paracoccaceae bacterium]MDE3237948.1 hypothetical protein [Paracoccaceae bacterium]
MKKLFTTTAIVLLAAGAAYADGYNAPAVPTIGASVHGDSSGIGNNATTVYQGASVTNSHDSAVNSASNTQAGFLNSFVSAQAGEEATANAGEISVDAPLVQVSVGAPSQGQQGDNHGDHNQNASAGGTINMSGMFQLMNTTNSIGN